jgi:hypothetical protein
VRISLAVTDDATRCHARQSVHCRQRFLAGGFAVPARLRADAAMLVHLGVTPALIGAGATCHSARLQQGTTDVGVVAGVPRQDSSGGAADVGAVKVGTDALRKLGDGLFTEAGVRARGAGLAADDQRIDRSARRRRSRLISNGYGTRDRPRQSGRRGRHCRRTDGRTAIVRLRLRVPPPSVSGRTVRQFLLRRLHRHVQLLDPSRCTQHQPVA